jgi:glycerophosphoryl diester phosphodiesterase
MKYISVSSIAIALLFSCTAQKQSQQNDKTVTYPSFDKQGHRGSRGLMPENTIPAMKKAIDLNVTTLEMDANITKDKKVVVSHDPYFNADITTTPDGKFLSKEEASKLLLYGMTYDEIKKYDVGLKPHPSFPRQQKIAVHKPLPNLSKPAKPMRRKKARTRCGIILKPNQKKVVMESNTPRRKNL